MATSLTAALRASINATFTDDQDLGDPTVQVALSALESLANGTSNVQADKIFSDTVTIELSGDDVLDMGTTGGMLDAFGDAFEPVEVVAVLLVADDGNTNNVVVGANASEPFLGPMAGTAPTTAVKPGGWLFWFAPAGWAVANNTNDKLKIANSGAGTGVTFSIIILGRSA
jgi:hypothetical protein